MSPIQQIIIGQPQAYFADPHLWVDSRATLSIRFSVYECLVKYDKDAMIIPGLAYEWSLADDARTWTFKLRPDVLFHDGSPLTAADAAASILRACGPEMPGEYGTAALLASYLGNSKIEVVDRLTLRIVTSEPIADLLDLLMYVVIVPEKFIAHIDARVPGTGPYCLEDEKPGEIRLRRNENYWSSISPVERLIFRGIAEEAERVRAFQQGEVDVITYMPLSYSKDFAGSPGVRIIERSTPMCVIIICNAAAGPCTDRRVRQALNHATNVDLLIEKIYDGCAFPLNGPLSKHHHGNDPDVLPYSYDPLKARQLLKEAGYDELSLTLDRPVVCPDESPVLARMLKEMWAKVGITLDERVEENREQYALNVRNKKITELCIFDSSPMSTYRVLREKLNSKFAGSWWEGYHNAEVNALMEKAWLTVDDRVRVQLYQQVYRLIYEDAPWIFLYSPMDMWVVRDRITKDLPDWGPGVDGLVLFGQG
jgi:peptide/nickel transport system substrate-binding protein